MRELPLTQKFALRDRFGCHSNRAILKLEGPVKQSPGKMPERDNCKCWLSLVLIFMGASKRDAHCVKAVCCPEPGVGWRRLVGRAHASASSSCDAKFSGDAERRAARGAGNRGLCTMLSQTSKSEHHPPYDLKTSKSWFIGEKGGGCGAIMGGRLEWEEDISLFLVGCFLTPAMKHKI